MIVAAENASAHLSSSLLVCLDLSAEEWEGTHFPNLAVRDEAASNGAALRVTPPARRGPGKLFWGPFYALRPGRYRATYRH